MTVLDLPDLGEERLGKVVSEFRSETWKQATGTLLREARIEQARHKPMKIGDFLDELGGGTGVTAASLGQVFSAFTTEEIVVRSYCAMGVIGKVLLNLDDTRIVGGSNLEPFGIHGPYCERVISLNDSDVSLSNIGNAIEWALLTNGLRQQPDTMRDFALHLHKGGKVSEFDARLRVSKENGPCQCVQCTAKKLKPSSVTYIADQDMYVLPGGEKITGQALFSVDPALRQKVLESVVAKDKLITGKQAGELMWNVKKKRALAGT